MNSLWRKTVRMPQFDALHGDRKTQVLIIGGGMAGILCAHALEKAGVDYLLVESGRICSGVTGNTTAKITAQHGLIYHRLAQQFDLNTARLYLQANQQALDRFWELCAGLDCEFEERDSYVYSRSGKEELDKELDVLEQLGVGASFVRTTPLPFLTAGAVKLPHQGQFHPLKFIAAIAGGLNICENTRVEELRPDGVQTSGGRVQADKIIVATHFPFLNKHGGYFLKLYQHRSYVLALKGAALPEGMYVDECDTGMSFRSYGNLLLLGGGGHRTGKPGGGWQELERLVRRCWPRAREMARWATQDCVTLDGMPYIGRYSSRTPGLYVATGFNKWGMTSSMAAAQLLCDLVQGRQNPYEELFSPSRTMMRRQLAVNIGEAAAGLLSWKTPRCPHMGCALKYNRQEHSWDCSCHGSRFDREGRLLDNPATGDKKLG